MCAFLSRKEPAVLQLTDSVKDHSKIIVSYNKMTSLKLQSEFWLYIY